MKRMMVLAAAAVCLSLAISSAALAEPPNTVQPACADITDTTGITGGSYLSPVSGVPATGVYGAIDVMAPTCTNVNYTAVVFTYGPRGFVSSVRVQTQRGLGDGTTTTLPVTVLTPTAQFACVFFVTSIGLHVLDVAPDNGCPLRINVAPGAQNAFNVMPLDGGSPGGGGFN